MTHLPEEKAQKAVETSSTAHSNTQFSMALHSTVTEHFVNGGIFYNFFLILLHIETGFC